MPSSTRPTIEDVDIFHGPLRYWFLENKRDLPWRRMFWNAYAVWVSEIMLQQTQVATVIPYFERWMCSFPTVESLANAELEEVLQHWSGLGYYARGRNLHRAAKMVVDGYNGSIPQEQPALLKLPGIGRYTSGAILSIAFNQPEPLVDTNVIRVLSRVFAIAGDPKSSAVSETIWKFAKQLMPDGTASDHNQALMELGATLCIPVDPRCPRCPLVGICVAGNSPDPTLFPQLAPGRATVQQSHTSVIIERNGKYLMVQRYLNGLWGGLWEFPRRVANKGETALQCAIRAAKEVVGLEVVPMETVATVKHAVTHHRIVLTGVLAVWQLGEPTRLDCAELRWLTLDELDSVATSSPQSTIISKTKQKYRTSGVIQKEIPFEA